MKFNKNIIVFIAVMIFIFAGFTIKYYDALKYEILSFLVQNEDAAEDLPTLLSNIDDISTEKLRYHNDMMDLDSIKQRMLQTRVIKKSSSNTIVRAKNDTLIEPKTASFTDEEMATIVNNIVELKDYANSTGAEFLYVAAPDKLQVAELPPNVIDYGKANYTHLLDDLTKSSVPTLDLRKLLDENGLLSSSLYFQTDHHWKPEVGFWAAGEICKNLNERYGFEYNTAYTDISNYNITVYEDIFLGSYGKKVGLHFVSGGAEDISLITPRFNTNLTEIRPYANIERAGSFQDTVLHMENISSVDYYEKNPYATYSGGDFRLQIIKNNLTPYGKKILLIRDSFACVVAPFIALNAGELHIVDIRDFIPSESLDLREYIDESNPDYVIILYSGAGSVSDSADRFDFNLS